MKKIYLENDDATSNIGKLISQDILNISKDNIEIHLEGDLGAGKTFLTRSIISHAGWSGLVKSPTYTLCEEYELNKLLFLHIDLYRSDESEDLDIFNLNRETHLKKIIIIEWSDKLKENRAFDLKIKFEHINNQREIEIIDKSNLFLALIKS
jgi:tRNA threonylcarbamoyladenosine biosynthesis protein TsaE